MKSLKIYGTALLLGVVTLFQSCDNDGYSLNDIARDWVTVHVEGDGMYSFTGDHWGTLWPTTASVWYRPVEGERAILYFNPLQDDYEGYDTAIRPEFISPILTKPVEELTLANEKEYGDHPAYINDIWIAGGYLNMIFLQKLPQKEPHRVSLVRNTITPQEEDGYIHLEYRYNTYGDTLNIAEPGAVCYNLNTLDLEHAKGIKLTIHSAVNGKRVLTFDNLNEDIPDEAKTWSISGMKVR